MEGWHGVLGDTTRTTCQGLRVTHRGIPPVPPGGVGTCTQIEEGGEKGVEEDEERSPGGRKGKKEGRQESQGTKRAEKFFLLRVQAEIRKQMLMCIEGEGQGLW